MTVGALLSTSEKFGKPEIFHLSLQVNEYQYLIYDFYWFWLQFCNLNINFTPRMPQKIFL